jgi:N6-adenosine-specific RNA methylase IME4
LKSFADDTAAKTGKHRATISREVARTKVANLKSIVGTSLDTPLQLDRLLRVPESLQRNLIARAKTGEEINVRVEVMKDRRAQREQELAEGTKAAAEALGKKLYGVLYVDPPWRYETIGDRSADQHYTTMPVEEIKALRLPAYEDCVLFMWAVVPLLPEAFEVMKACVFTYKSECVWVKKKDGKPQIGTGFWARAQHEHLLIGVRGNIPAPAPGEQYPALIEAPRGRHSEKPDIFAEHIERLFPNVPKLEMFARKERPGWDVWGNEVPPKAEAAE